MAKKYSLLYLLFIHEGNLIMDESKPLESDFIKNSLNSFNRIEGDKNIKVVIIQSYRQTLRELTNKEKEAAYSKKYNNVIYFKTQVLESYWVANDLKFRKKYDAYNWQQAFDFVLKKFASERRILHTISHCSGFEINGTNDFVVNAFGGTINQLYQPKRENKLKETIFFKIINNQKRKFYLIGNRLNKYLLKNEPNYIRSINSWTNKNNTNGLNICDFANYLKRRNVVFECGFFNNCNFMLLNNLLAFKGIIKYIVGSTGNINYTHFKANSILKACIIKPQYNTTFFDNIFKELTGLAINEENKIRRYSVINIDNLNLITSELKTLFSAINKKLPKDEYKKLVKHCYDLLGSDQLPIVSDETEKPHVELLDLIVLFRKYFDVNNIQFEFSAIENMYNNAVIFKQSQNDKYNCISILIVPTDILQWRLSYFKNIYTSPYNNTFKSIAVDDFFYKALNTTL